MSSEYVNTFLLWLQTVHCQYPVYVSMPGVTNTVVRDVNTP